MAEFNKNKNIKQAKQSDKIPTKDSGETPRCQYALDQVYSSICILYFPGWKVNLFFLLQILIH